MISIPIRPTFLVVAFLLVVPVVVVVRSEETALSFRSLGSNSRPDDSIRNLQNVTDNGDVQNNVTDGDREDLQDEYLQCRNDTDKFLDANPSIREGVNKTESVLEQLLTPRGTVMGLTLVFLPGPMHAAGPICQEGGILANSGYQELQCVLDEALLDELELGGLDPNATVNANYLYVNNMEGCFANTESCNNVASSGKLLSHFFEAEKGWDCKAITEVGYDFDDISSAKEDEFAGTSFSAGTPRHHPWTVGTLAAFVVMPAAVGIAMTAF